MSLGVDALFLVALCGTAGWLLQRRQRGPAQPRARRSESESSEELAELRTGAAIALGAGEEDYVVTQVERLPSDAPLALLCHLDAGGEGGQGLLVIPRSELLLPASSRRCWLLRKLPRTVQWLPGAAEPPLSCDHAGTRFTLASRWSDVSRPGAPVEERRRIAVYQGPAEQRLLLWSWGRIEHSYAGRERRLHSLDILPSAS